MATEPIEIFCPKCGSKEYRREEDGYYCPACMTRFADKTVQEVNRMQSALDKYKQELLANARQNLYRAVQEKYRSHEQIKNWCNVIQQYIPNDFFANFYLSIETGAKSAQRFFQHNTIPNEYLDTVSQYIVKAIKNADLLEDVQNRIITDEEKRRSFQEYIRLINNGTFYTDLPRDVFIAYASEDKKKVEELVDYLENHEHKTCFVSYRNLWNGIGVENYEKELYKAMSHCKYFVFVSSEHSRRGEGCGTYQELVYLRDNLPNTPRIEYLLEEYGNGTPDFMKTLLKNYIFKGKTWVTEKEALSLRLSGVKDNPPPIDKGGSTATQDGEKSKPVGQKPCQHSFVVARIVEPTCKELGYTLERCTFCGENRKTHYTKTLSTHTFGEWLTKREATCTELGEERRQCKLCDHFETHAIPKKGHTYGEWYETKYATCTEDGEERRDCSSCGGYETRPKKALGHNYDQEEILVPATDKTPGKKEKTCSNCGNVITETIPCLKKKIKMTKKTKKIIVLVSAVLAVILIALGVVAIVDITQSNGLKLSLSNDKSYYIVKGIGKCKDTDIVIPSTYWGKPVREIDDSAFSHCSGLTTVEIPDSVTSIGDLAFYNCSRLSSVVIPNSVTSIGSYAFYNCSGLTSVTIGNSVKSIGNQAFSYCYKLVEVYNKSSLPIAKESYDYGWVGYYAKNVYTSSSGSSKLTTDKDGYIIYIDGTNRILIDYTGQEKDLTLPTSITEIYERAFYYRTDITSVVIPNSVTSIGFSAFSGCSKLTSVVIPDSVTSISSYAFYNCSGLTSVVIGSGVTSIDRYAFYRCSGLTSVTFENTSGWYVSTDYWVTIGTSVTVTDPSQNATYLTSTYDEYYWKHT